LIRGQKVMIDFELAELYGVTTKQLNQQVSRNRKRFPEDFMFRLTRTKAEAFTSRVINSDSNLRSQSAISRSAHGGRRYLPHAFTEQGVKVRMRKNSLIDVEKV
jgi:hypothetical protein